jgi:DNA-directed RNA polymerase specialized sigma24 family protein
MQHLGPIKLLDGNGEPFSEHIQEVLDKLSPRLRREFPVLQDDVALIEVLEEGGRRIAAREARGGPIDRLHGYAWVTLRSVATTHIRRGQIRLIQNAVSPTSSAARLAAMPSASGGVEAIERNVLFREVLEVLSKDERDVVTWRASGYSSADIARFLGRSIDAVNKVFSRAKQKARRVLGGEHS